MTGLRHIAAVMDAAGRAAAEVLGSVNLLPPLGPPPAIPGIPSLPSLPALAPLPAFSGSPSLTGARLLALFRQAEGEQPEPPAETGDSEPLPAPASDPFRKLAADELTPEELTDYLSVERVATVLHCTPEAVNLLCAKDETRNLLQPIKSGNRWLFRAVNVRRYQLWAQSQNEQRKRGRPRAVGRIIPPFEESPER